MLTTRCGTAPAGGTAPSAGGTAAHNHVALSLVQATLLPIVQTALLPVVQAALPLLASLPGWRHCPCWRHCQVGGTSRLPLGAALPLVRAALPPSLGGAAPLVRARLPLVWARC